MIKYIILITDANLELATLTRFNHEYEAKEWIVENGKSYTGYVIMKEYRK